MVQVFISYKSEYRDFARRIAQSLRARGLGVWLDIDNIPSGAYFRDEIEKGLDSSDFLLLLVSPEAMESREITAEWTYFLANKKPVIPVIVQAAIMHFRLQNIQWIDATDPLKYEAAIDKVEQLILDRKALNISINEARRQELQIEHAIASQIIAEDTFQFSETASVKKIDAQNLLHEAQSHLKNKAISKAVENFTEVLLDRCDPILRIQALNALAELRAASNDIKQSLTNDPVAEVRKAAVRALANFQSPHISDVLQLTVITDESIEVRLYAALVDLYYRQPNHVTGWLNMLASSNDPTLRAIASEAQLFANDLTESGSHVFVSYSRQDAETFSLQLVDDLRNREKFRVWIDTNLTPGTESWKKAIAKSIEQCSLLLLVLSPAVHNSRWIGEEVSYAEQLGKDRLYVKYEHTHLPFGMSEMQGLRSDLTFKDYPQEMYSALVTEFDRRNIPRSE